MMPVERLIDLGAHLPSTKVRAHSGSTGINQRLRLSRPAHGDARVVVEVVRFHLKVLFL